MIIQPIVNIAEICAQKGVNHIVLSPGSRCAQLAIAFVRHPDVQVYTISDERSAAFIALGMAQQLKRPVALLCTSGTAALNYYPAITEAFYQHIPLVVFTADRPDEWVDQLDGQTIRQRDVYANHIKKSYHLPVDYSHPDAIWYAYRSVNEAINVSLHEVKGPVHINVPIREPFYPSADEQMAFDKNVRITQVVAPSKQLSKHALADIAKVLGKSSRIVVVAGQQDYDSDLHKVLETFSTQKNIPILADVISNLQITNRISHLDITLFDNHLHEDLHPDCIISFGKSILSKNLKNFIRKTPPKHHIHLQPNMEISDYFQSIDTLVNADPKAFFSELQEHDMSNSKDYLMKWVNTQTGFMEKLEAHFSNSVFSEFQSIYQIIKQLPENSILHLANSMSVRYANYLKLNSNIEVYSNRGTSGIDGCTSTAVGCALATDRIVTLITGDMAFLYDRNALWSNYLPSNLRIIVLNNHAGGIFRIIDGSNKQPELKEFFETEQRQSACNSAKDADMHYVSVSDMEGLKSQLDVFWGESDKAKICEIFTTSEENAKVLKDFTMKFK